MAASIRTLAPATRAASPLVWVLGEWIDPPASGAYHTLQTGLISQNNSRKQEFSLPPDIETRTRGIVNDTGRLSVDEPGVFGFERSAVGRIEEVLKMLHEDTLEDLLVGVTNGRTASVVAGLL